MRRTALRSKEFQKELEQSGYPIEVTKRDIIELLEDGSFEVILLNHQPAFFYTESAGLNLQPSRKMLVPHLRYLQRSPDLLKKITVDPGAVKFVVNGADIMRPGITTIEEDVKKDDLVAVIDQNYRKPLAVGLALFNSLEMNALASGKAVKNIHYVGDELWSFSEKRETEK